MITNQYFDRFQTKKYRAGNGVQRLLIRRFLTTLHGLFRSSEPISRVLEVGVGEGFISGWLSERYPDKTYVGIDLNEGDLTNLRRLFPRIEAHAGSAYELTKLQTTFDLVICAEVLEHLDEPDRALEQIAAVASRRAILTVPHEPWFMLSNLARGKNVTRFGNDPEHINHWGRGSFRRLIDKRFEVLDITTAYPWILALARPR